LKIFRKKLIYEGKKCRTEYDSQNDILGPGGEIILIGYLPENQSGYEIAKKENEDKKI